MTPGETGAAPRDHRPRGSICAPECRNNRRGIAADGRNGNRYGASAPGRRSTRRRPEGLIPCPDTADGAWMEQCFGRRPMHSLGAKSQRLSSHTRGGGKGIQHWADGGGRNGCGSGEIRGTAAPPGRSNGCQAVGRNGRQIRAMERDGANGRRGQTSGFAQLSSRAPAYLHHTRGYECGTSSSRALNRIL